MCDKFTILSKENETHYIAQCKHDTIHIIWGNLSLRFKPTDFLRLADAIENFYTHTKSQSELDNNFRIYIKDVLLLFSVNDLGLLRDLIWLASLNMRKEQATKEINLLDLPSLETAHVDKKTSLGTLN